MRILIALEDITDAVITQAAFNLGAQFASRQDVTLSLMTVVDRARREKNAQAELAEAVELHLDHLPAYPAEVHVGDSAEEIMKELTEGEYDLLILAIRHPEQRYRRPRLDELVKKLLSETACPLVIVRDQATPLERILVCESAAREDSQLHSFLSHLVDLIGTDKEVTVLHVMSHMSAGPGVKGWQLRADAEEIMEQQTPEGRVLEQDLDILKETEIEAVPKVRHGLVIDEILEEVQSGEYDLIVIGAHWRSGWQRMLLTNIAKEIIVHLDLPVLIVPQN